MPKPAEVAQLAIAGMGMTFEDWDTVWVQNRWQEPWSLFRFTCAERAPLSLDWTVLKFKPGDGCTIILGGQLAITGVILTRQTNYDATTHTVTLSGVSKTWGGATSSVDSKNGSFDKMGITQVVMKVMKPFCNVSVIGNIDNTPFDRLQCQPGETNFDFIDRIARMRGVTLGSDKLGSLLLIGEHTNPVVQQLYEGVNILKMQCTMTREFVADFYAARGQKALEDGTAMREAAEMFARAQGTSPGLFKWLDTVVETPVKNIIEVIKRVNIEAIAREGTLITANVTVQGWLRSPGALWEPGDNVLIHSPMAMLSMVMKIRTATFSQDDSSGTITTLECVLPWMLGDKYAERGQLKPPLPAEPQFHPSESENV